VPSGNFGNVTAGLIACALGLPAARMIAATNANDTVPRYLAGGQWAPNPTVPTLTNAMDVAEPNNFSRVLELGKRHRLDLDRLLRSTSLDDAATREAMRELYTRGYLADPHSALAWRALRDASDDPSAASRGGGVFLCTAHPAKFREHVQSTVGEAVELPEALRAVADREVLSEVVSSDFDAFREILRSLAGP